MYKTKTMNLKKTTRNLHYEIITYKQTQKQIQMCKVQLSLLIKSKYHQITLLMSHVVLIKWKVNILPDRQLASI